MRSKEIIRSLEEEVEALAEDLEEEEENLMIIMIIDPKLRAMIIREGIIRRKEIIKKMVMEIIDIIEVINLS